MTAKVYAAVVEKAVAVCGSAFYYRYSLRTVLLAAGVPEDVYRRYAVEGATKYVIARDVLTDLLGRGEAGHEVLARGDRAREHGAPRAARHRPGTWRGGLCAGSRAIACSTRVTSPWGTWEATSAGGPDRGPAA